jgi:outer membrane protein assembly factor BamB
MKLFAQISIVILFASFFMCCSKNNNTADSNSNNNTTPPNPLVTFNSPHELVFVMCNNNKLNAVNANDGSVKWSVSLTTNFYSLPALTPTLAGYATDSIAALNAQTGQILWRIKVPNLYESSQACPLIYNNVLYIGGGPYFYAINTSNGSIKWSYTNQPSNTGNSFSECSPTISNGKIFINCTGGFGEGLYCFDAITGANCGRALPSSNLYSSKSSPCVFNNFIFDLFHGNIVNSNGYFFKLDMNNNFNQVPGGYFASNIYISSPTVYNNILFFGADSSMFAINDIITTPNSLKWEFKGASYMGSSSPTVANDMAYIGSEKGIIYCINVLTGLKKWEFDVKNYGTLFVGHQTSPTVADNILYYSCANGLFAINADTGKLIWQSNLAYAIRSPSVLSKTGEVFQSGLSGLKN